MAPETEEQPRHRRRGQRKGWGKRGEEKMVPDADFTSYYGRRIVKESPWEIDIPIYLFTGGMAAGSSLLAAGADLTGRVGLRTGCRVGALGAMVVTLGALVHDLGKPSRFLNMLRTVKLTSPMSMGTWILIVYGPMAGLAAASELSDLLPRRWAAVSRLLGGSGRPAGLVAATFAPALGVYTAVLLTDTATPSWHDAHRELPFVFAGSAAAAAGGLGMLVAPTDQTGPARRLAVGGAALEAAADQLMERSMGITAEPMHTGRAGKYLATAKALNVAGVAGAIFAAGRSRVGAAVSGASFLAGSLLTRMGIFEAGQASTRDPKYVVVPQRERQERGK